MLFRNHYQSGYVTRDMDLARPMVSERVGVTDWVMFEPAEIPVMTPRGPREYRARMALGWSGGLQIELIEPLNDDTRALYSDALAPDGKDYVPRFHHVAVRRATLENLRSEIESLGLPLLMAGEVPGFHFYYVDYREQLGHHVELTWASEEMWAYNKWPANKLVE